MNPSFSDLSYLWLFCQHLFWWISFLGDFPWDVFTFFCLCTSCLVPCLPIIYTLTAPSLCWPLSWWSLISKPLFDMPFWMSYCRFRNNHFIFPLLCQYRQHNHPPANQPGRLSSFRLAPYTLSMYKPLGSSSIITTNLFSPCILYPSSMS